MVPVHFKEVFRTYLAGVSSASILAGTEHGRSYPPEVVLVTDIEGQDGDVHLLEPVNPRTI